MKKIKMVLTCLAVTWLACYTLVFLVNMIVFPASSATAGDYATQPMAAVSNAIVKVSASSSAALSPIIGQTEKADLFTRPILPSSLGTIVFGLWAYCGYELSRQGYRGVPPIRK